LKANDEKSRIRIRKSEVRICGSGCGSVPKWHGSTSQEASEKFDEGMKVLMHAQLDAKDSYLRERLSLLSRGDKLWRSFSETREGNRIKLLLSPK
jgi:hypothetical protein